MLHVIVATESETFLGTSFGVKPYQVSGNVFYALFCAVFDFLPCTCAKMTDFRRRSFFSAILAKFVKGIDGHHDYVAAGVNKFYRFLTGIAFAYMNKSHKYTYSVIGMNHIVSYLQVVYFF